ncbi:MAG: PilZ domain-containing protein [Bdellovibrionales bacterium]
MQKMLIHCQGAAEHGEQIKNFIETRLPYEVSISFDRKMTQDLLGQRSIQMLLFETNKFVENDLILLKDVRASGFVYPSLIIAESIEVPNFLAVAEKFKTHLLTKPFEFKALRGITQKLMLARSVPQQMHRRFRTQQNTVLETYLTGEVISSQMYNLSVGGAYFEFNDKPRVAVGDLVRLKVNLNDVSREHCVNARVVWTTRKGMNGGGFGAGVRFIKGQDIYRQLMDKV